jgi:hypothetical protein
MRKNDGRRQFLLKWRMTQSAFDRYFLRRGQPVPNAENGIVVGEPRRSPRLALEQIKALAKRLLG